MWPELFGQFWGLVILTVIAVALSYISLVLYRYRVSEIDQGRRPEGLWWPLMAINLGLCALHAGMGIFTALGHY